MALLKIVDKNGNIIEVPALKGDKYTLTENDKVEIANQVGSEFVHHSEVVDNLVVDGQPQWDKIPNGEALQAFIIGNAVSSAITQSLSDTKKARARRNIGALSYLEPDDKYDLPLSDGEKAQARNNIGAFDASKIINAENYSGAPDDGVYDKSAMQQFALINTVTVSPNQTLPERKKQIGRKNIDVDGGKWEKLFTIEGDGDTTKWEYTQIPDGTPIKLSAVAITVTQTVAETANVYGQLYGYYNDTYVGLTTISKILTTGVLDGQATAVIQPNKGYYEAYGVDMAKGNPANMSYSGFRQFMSSTTDLPYINKIKIVIQNTIKMSVGNKIDVWGVKYYE